MAEVQVATESGVDQSELLRRVYAAFNRREIETVLAAMNTDVDWPNGMEGGRVRGHAAVRGYWKRQFEVLDPKVEPRSFAREADGRIAVAVFSGRPSGTLIYSATVSAAGTGMPTLVYRLWESGAGSVNSCNTPPLWISNTGSQVLIECYAAASPEVRIVLINHGHVTALPWLDATANEVTAFPGLTAIGVPANADG